MGCGRPALQLELLPLVKNTPCLALPLLSPRCPSAAPQSLPAPPAQAPPRGLLCLLLICPLAELAPGLRREGREDTVGKR